MSFLGYLGRYFVARSLWNATHPPHRPARSTDYIWQAGDEVILRDRGHFAFDGREWRLVDPPKE